MNDDRNQNTINAQTIISNPDLQITKFTEFVNEMIVRGICKEAVVTDSYQKRVF